MDKIKKITHKTYAFFNFDPLVFYCSMILLIEFVYIFTVLLNYYFSWMQVEIYTSNPWIFSNGREWHWADFTRFLDTTNMEGDPNRITRPVSGLVQMFNAKFRAFCWNFIPPHPTLSFYWLFSFAVLPVLLYKFFRNCGCATYISLGGVTLYLSSIGFLASIVMYMRPAKSLVSFFAVVCLYLGSKLYKKAMGLAAGSSFKEIPHFGRDFLILLFTLFFSFFCDETGIFICVMVFFLLYPIFLRFKEKPFLLGAFLVLPAAYLLMAYVILPYIHFILFKESVNVSRFYDYPHDLFAFLKPSWWIEPVINADWFLHDHPHLQPNTANLLPNNKPLFVAQLIYMALMYFVLFLFAMAVRHWWGSRRQSLENTPKMPLKKVFIAGALFFPFVFFHTVMMLRTGLGYYGGFYSLIYYITLTFIFQFILERNKGRLFKSLFPLIVLVFTVHGLLFSTYRVDILDENKWGRHFIYDNEQISTGKTGYYFKNFNIIDGIKKSECRYLYIDSLWASRKGKKQPVLSQNKIDYCNAMLVRDPTFPAEARFFNAEMD